METNKYDFHIHIVNSVKGGSGKSTFSLLLADHFVRKHEKAYVIDLDMCGTSWYFDFQKYWEQPDDLSFINQIIYAPCEGGFGTNIWSQLRVADTASASPRKINVCISAKDQHDQLSDIPEVELLEHITYHLIKDVLVANHNTPDKEKEILQGYHPVLHVLLQAFKAVCILDNVSNLIHESQKDSSWLNIAEEIRTKAKEFSDKATKLLTSINNDIKKEEPLTEGKYDTQQQDLLALVKLMISYTNLVIEWDPTKTGKLSDDKKLDSDHDNGEDFDSFCDSVADYLVKNYKAIGKGRTTEERANELWKLTQIKTCNDLLNRTSSDIVHFILDLPPSHEATAEQICHRLFFDNNSPLNKDYCEKFKVNLYMMTPIDQMSAFEKNKAYVRNLVDIRPRYSSTIKKFINDERMKICFVVVDNHGWALNVSKISPPDPETNIMKLDIPPNTDIAYLPFMKFNFKEGGILSTTPSPDDSLDLSGKDTKKISEIVDKMK